MHKYSWIFICFAFYCHGTFADTFTLNWLNEDKTTYTTTTCESGNDVILPTAPTKRGYTFIGWAANYIPLEYIESTKKQYIDTRWKFTGSTVTYDLIYSHSQTGVQSQALFGASVSDRGWTGIPYYSQADVNRLSLGTDVNILPLAETVNTIYTYSLTVNRTNQTWAITKNGVSYSGSFAGSPVNNVNITLFAHNNNGSIWQQAQYRNYGFKITEDGTLVRNMIPVLDSDGVACMYDKVTNTFFYDNVGTEDFIAGPVIRE